MLPIILEIKFFVWLINKNLLITHISANLLKNIILLEIGLKC